jgi:hypothetical protein
MAKYLVLIVRNCDEDDVCQGPDCEGPGEFEVDFQRLRGRDLVDGSLPTGGPGPVLCSACISDFNDGRFGPDDLVDPDVEEEEQEEEEEEDELRRRRRA